MPFIPFTLNQLNNSSVISNPCVANISLTNKSPRRTLFKTSTPIAPKTPQSKIKTSKYKKLKSVQGRKPTPRKVLSPGKKLLLAKLRKYKREMRNCQQNIKRMKIKKPKNMTKELLIEEMKSFLPKSVCSFFSMQLNQAGLRKHQWSEEGKRLALSMRYKTTSLYKQMKNDGFALPSQRT